tara:strand:- start:942 stop:1112 length:171 start_codon:yes stop_codon:yes gene_type:complete
MNRQIQNAMNNDEAYAQKVEANEQFARAELRARNITRLQFHMIMRDIQRGIMPYID